MLLWQRMICTITYILICCDRNITAVSIAASTKLSRNMQYPRRDIFFMLLLTVHVLGIVQVVI